MESSPPQTDLKAMPNQFKLHVVPPPAPLEWTHPRELLKKTLWHHLIQDTYPIGHFYIEIESETPNAYGVNRVITGMSRQNRNRSTLKVAMERIGMGTFFYDFPGKLDSGVDAHRGVEWARRRGRLKTVVVPLSPEQVRLLFDELHLWILNGSFRHYGGGHQILLGQGSGCAEMGAHFFNLALGKKAVPESWIRRVYAPNRLVGGGDTGRKVGMLKLYFEGLEWAKGPEDGRLIATPDMELAWEWLEKHHPGKQWVTLTPADFPLAEEAVERIRFTAGYPVESEETLRQQWARLRVDPA
jgi:hypothetical protein